MAAVRDLFDSLASRTDEFADAVTHRIRAEVPAYLRLNEAQHRQAVRAQLITILTGLAARQPPSTKAVQQVRDLGRRRAGDGLALPEVIEAYHIAYRETWNELMVAAARHQPDLTADLAREVALVWSWFHRLAGAVADAYAAEMRDRSASRFALRRRLRRALANSEDHEEASAAAAELGLRPTADFVALAVGPLDNAVTERLDADLADRRLPAIALHEGGRAVLLGQGSPEELLAAVRRFEPDAVAAVGLPRPGIAGAAAALIDADQSWALAVTVQLVPEPVSA